MYENAPVTIQTVLGEANPELRKGMQGALFGAGIREVELCRDAFALEGRLQKKTVDLIICDIDLPGLYFCAMVQRIRQATFATNPFAVIIATLNDAPMAQIREIINSGADHLIRKPMPMSKLVNDVKTFLQNRRPFVATEDYAGPTRRAKPRPGEPADLLLKAPNPLRSKMIDRANPRDIQMQIDRGIDEMLRLRRQNTAGGIWRVIRRAVSHYEGQGDADDRRRDLDRFLHLTESLAARYGGGTDRLAEISGHLRRVAETVSGTVGEPDKRYLQMLSTLGQLFHASLLADAEPFAIDRHGAVITDSEAPNAGTGPAAQ